MLISLHYPTTGAVETIKIAMETLTDAELNNCFMLMDCDTFYYEDDLEYFRTIHSLCYRTLNINSGQVFKGERVKEFSEIARIEMSGVSEEDTSGLAVGNKRGDLLLFCDEVSRSSERDLKLFSFSKNEEILTISYFQGFYTNNIEIIYPYIFQ